MPIVKHPFSQSDITKACDILTKGGLVVFPTETVYGLGASALDEQACKKIFEAKGRPSDNPLIVHVGNKDDIFIYGKDISKETSKLINTFWPGPLTVIVKKSQNIGQVVSGGLESVGLRFPAHPFAQKLIRTCGFPLAAPSANLSGKPSPTNAQDVWRDLEKKVDLIFDGGNTKHGLESTVIDMTSPLPTILRHGSITIEMIKKILPNVTDSIEVGQSKKSPGTRYRHYAPETPLRVISKNERDVYLNKDNGQKAYIGLKIPGGKNTFSFSSKKDFAKKLYSTLRHCDTLGVQEIIVEEVGERGIGRALMNRIKKAAGLI